MMGGLMYAEPIVEVKRRVSEMAQYGVQPPFGMHQGQMPYDVSVLMK